MKPPVILLVVFLLLFNMAGIYIHIPFCKQKCTYCDFHFSTSFKHYEALMIDSLIKEIKLRKNELLNESIQTIYFGGGTPSILQISDLEKILTTIYNTHSVSSNVEITLECNPDDISKEKVIAWKNLKINRLSIGLQSFDQEDLDWMKRAHTADESINSVQIAKENGIDNISIDLIYGLPNMSLARWKKQLDKAFKLNVKHISAYCLTVENKTELQLLVKQNKLTISENSLQAKHFQLLQKESEKNNFIQYEISNFGLKDYFSKHNCSYWKNEIYQGIGPSAHSYFNNKRSWNISNNQKYIKSIQANIPCSESEELTDKNRFNETLLTGLRTIWGVSLEELETIILPKKPFYDKIALLSSEKKLKVKDNRITLTNNGLLFADAIAVSLFE